MAVVSAGGTVAIAIMVYPLSGLVAALLLSGLSQLAVLIPDFFSVSKLAALIAALGYLRRRTTAMDLKRVWRSRAFVTYVLPAAWFSLTGLVGDASIALKISRLYNISAILTLVFLVCSVPLDVKELKKAILAIVMGCGILGLWVSFFGGSGLTRDLYEAVDGVTVYYDHDFAIQLSLALCLSWALFEGMSKAWTITTIAVNASLVICVLLTHSRTAWMGLAVSITFALLWLLSRGGFKHFGRLGVAVAAVIASSFVLLQLDFFQPVLGLVLPRVETLSDLRGSSTGRLEYLWPEAIALIIERPLLGGGLGANSHYFTAHNAFLESGVEGGLIGMVLYVISVFYTIYGANRSQNLWLRICGVAVGTFIVTVSQTNPSTFYSLPYGFVVGIVAWIETHNVRSNTLRGRRPLPEYEPRSLSPTDAPGARAM